LASARSTVASSHSGVSSRRWWSDGTGSVKSLAMIARVVAPVNGVEPPTISYSMAPSE
jgi:hypothetical protein